MAIFRSNRFLETIKGDGSRNDQAMNDLTQSLTG